MYVLEGITHKVSSAMHDVGDPATSMDAATASAMVACWKKIGVQLIGDTYLKGNRLASWIMPDSSVCCVSNSLTVLGTALYHLYSACANLTGVNASGGQLSQIFLGAEIAMQRVIFTFLVQLRGTDKAAYNKFVVELIHS
jgi:hypothetical protein